MSRAPGSYAGLTAAQADLLSYIREEASRDRTPSFEEMATALGLASKSGVHRLIAGLQERGYVTRLPGLHRSIICHERSAVRDITSVTTGDLIRELEGRGFRFYGRSAEAG